MKQRHRGNVLQVTLIMLVSLLFYVSVIGQIVIYNARNFKDIKSCDKIRIIETTFFSYLKKENRDSVLLSGELRKEGCEIEYTVDDMGDYLLVKSRIQFPDNQYNIELDLLKEENYFKRIEYK